MLPLACRGCLSDAACAVAAINATTCRQCCSQAALCQGEQRAAVVGVELHQGRVGAGVQHGIQSLPFDALVVGESLM
jgi:hypothetical protein